MPILPMKKILLCFLSSFSLLFAHAQAPTPVETGLLDESNFLQDEDAKKIQQQSLSSVNAPIFNFQSKSGQVHLDSNANQADWKNEWNQDEPLSGWDYILTKKYIQKFKISKIIVVDKRRYNAGFREDVNFSYNSFEYNPDDLLARHRTAYRKGEELRRYTTFYYNANKQISTRRYFRDDSLRDHSTWKYLPDGKLLSREDFHVVQLSFPRDRASFRWTNDTLRQCFDYEHQRVETVRFSQAKIVERTASAGIFRFHYLEDGRLSHETTIGWDDQETELRRYHYDENNWLVKIETSETERVFERDSQGLILREKTMRKADGSSIYGATFEYEYEYR
ncbi:MAG: hypothetical protein RL757_83 [Bacteroidota bacterium]|jgi:hypothetical protein